MTMFEFNFKSHSFGLDSTAEAERFNRQHPHVGLVIKRDGDSSIFVKTSNSIRSIYYTSFGDSVPPCVMTLEYILATRAPRYYEDVKVYLCDDLEELERLDTINALKNGTL